MSDLRDLVPAGVVTGQDVQKVFAHAKTDQYVLPAADCIGTNSVNSALETARNVNSPVIVQFSTGGSAFFAGKGLDNAGQKVKLVIRKVPICPTRSSMIHAPGCGMVKRAS